MPMTRVRKPRELSCGFGAVQGSEGWAASARASLIRDQVGQRRSWAEWRSAPHHGPGLSWCKDVRFRGPRQRRSVRLTLDGEGQGSGALSALDPGDATRSSRWGLAHMCGAVETEGGVDNQFGPLRGPPQEERVRAVDSSEVETKDGTALLPTLWVIGQDNVVEPELCLVRQQGEARTSASSRACRTGVRCIAQLGYHVTASDLSPRANERAKQEATVRDLPVRFSVADMSDAFDHHRHARPCRRYARPCLRFFSQRRRCPYCLRLLSRPTRE
jgi:hypothetical protein